MIHELFKHSEHLDKLPFTVVGGVETIVYVRVGYDQYWRNPTGGWDKTDYREVLETLRNIRAHA